MNKQIHIFLTALMFFTRIPVSKNLPYKEEYLNSATKFLPTIGLLIGGFAAFVYYAAHWVLPQSVAVILSMIATIILTGAFHEDGFADVCDGFGGGWTKSKILEIMKDSRVGAYGVIGTVLMLLLKYVTLSEIPHSYIILILISGHTVSRFMAVCFIYFFQYARDDASTKTKPLGKKLENIEMLWAIITGVLPFFFFDSYWFFVLIIPCLLAFFFFARYIVKWIGGFTGDCLGATQQLTEVVFYLAALVLVRQIF
ncbi:MAG: adenosylcobinamide-GDP ribazoletransferase [Bacteroidales bacterium]|nr:adenosylcobinamide-GDP ribazoletransferase [Bacteroidales bacterium]